MSCSTHLARFLPSAPLPPLSSALSGPFPSGGIVPPISISTRTKGFSWRLLAFPPGKNTVSSSHVLPSPASWHIIFSFIPSPVLAEAMYKVTYQSRRGMNQLPTDFDFPPRPFPRFRPVRPIPRFPARRLSLPRTCARPNHSLPASTRAFPDLPLFSPRLLGNPLSPLLRINPRDFPFVELLPPGPTLRRPSTSLSFPLLAPLFTLPMSPALIGVDFRVQADPSSPLPVRFFGVPSFTGIKSLFPLSSSSPRFESLSPSVLFYPFPVPPTGGVLRTFSDKPPSWIPNALLSRPLLAFPSLLPYGT